MSRRLMGFEPLAAVLRASPFGQITGGVRPMQRYRVQGIFGGGVPRGRSRPRSPVPSFLTSTPRPHPAPRTTIPRPRRVDSYAPPPVVMAVIEDAPVIGDVVSGLSALGKAIGIGPSLSNVQCAPGNANYPACACPGGLLDASGTRCADGAAPGSIGGGGAGGGGIRYEVN